MERRQIVGSVCAICCTVGAGALISTATNHLQWVGEIGGALAVAGLTGLGILFALGPQKSEPDMPIREVFFYLDHDVLKAKPDHWPVVGKTLRDRLSTGRLTGWGRIIGRGNPHSRQRAALERIEASDWARADWTYFFFDEGVEMTTHILVKNGPIEGNTEWADIQFSRSEIVKLMPWPKRLWWKAKFPDKEKPPA